jgi:hypothetical protein
MDTTKTYLQILAENDAEAREEFEPSARELFLNRKDDSVEADCPERDEIEDQHLFQKEQGSHQQASLARLPPSYDDETTNGISYNTKDIIKHVINVDSQFRDNILEPSGDYRFTLDRGVKNIIRMKITSAEIPNTSYVFHCLKYNNVTFLISCPAITPTVKKLVLEDGNYSSFDLASVLQDRFDELFGSNLFTVTLSPTTAKLTIENIAKNNFSLTFGTFTPDGTTGTRPPRPYINGIGHNLGFNNLSYSGRSSYTSEKIVDTVEYKYMFISLGSDYDVVDHKSFNTHVSALAKICINVPKNAIIFNTAADGITKEFYFRQPTNLNSFQVRLIDCFEQVVDLNGSDFSFTLELTEVLNTSLYQKLL